MNQITDTIETLLCAFDVGFDNAYFMHNCQYVANANFTFWLDEDEKLDFNEAVECVKKYNSDTNNRYQLSVRKIGNKLLFQLVTTYDCTAWNKLDENSTK